MLESRIEFVAVESRLGAAHSQNYDCHLADADAPLLAVIDSECDDGTAGRIVRGALVGVARWLTATRGASPEDVQRALLDALRGASAEIRAIPAGAPGHRGGAAVTACACSGDTAIVAHVGDCRLYVLEAGQWVRRTKDHTLGEAIRSGAYAGSAQEEDMREMAASFQAGVLLEAVGPSEPLKVDFHCFSVATPASVLLCTRGAWLPVDPDGTGASLPFSADEHSIAGALLDRYSRDGQRDNATILVARLGKRIS